MKQRRGKKVRLSEEELATLKRSLEELTDDYALYLFGSRTDPEKRGGDIDILVISEKLNRRDLRKVRIDFFEKFGEQKLDIVLDDGTLSSPFVRHIIDKAVSL